MNHVLNASVSDCEYMYRILYEFYVYVKDSWKYYKEGFRIVPSTIKKRFIIVRVCVGIIGCKCSKYFTKIWTKYLINLFGEKNDACSFHKI